MRLRGSSTRITNTTDCKAEPGTFAPLVDRARCDGKAQCVEVCPEKAIKLARVTA